MTIETTEIQIATAANDVLDYLIGTLEKDANKNKSFLLGTMNYDMLDDLACKAGLDLDGSSTSEDLRSILLDVNVDFSLPYSTNPTYSWPIIDREKINFDTEGHEWQASIEAPVNDILNFFSGCGPTSLIAAMRCYAISKLGETTKVPTSLLTA